MTGDEFTRFIEKIDDIWPGLPSSWPDGSIQWIKRRVTPYTASSARFAIDRLANSEMRKLQVYRPDPRDVVKYVDDLGEPERRQLTTSTGTNVPWPQVSEELFGEYVPLSEASTRLEEAP